MGNIVRCITTDGAVMASAIDSTDIVYTAQRIHKTSPVVIAALGRLLSASSMMGQQLKQKNASMTLKINGGGPIGSIIAVSDSNGNCKGYVENPVVEAEKKANGKLDVSKAVGNNGLVYVMKDYGSGEPYIGQTPIVSGEIAEDITNYFAQSEQIPTVCALGVLVNKQNGMVLLSGGLLVQLLPGADDNTINKLEENVKKLEPVTTMLAKGYSNMDMIKKCLEGFEVEKISEDKVKYYCNCSKERVLKAISTLSDEEIKSLPNEKGIVEAKCHFCDKVINLTKQDLQTILSIR